MIPAILYKSVYINIVLILTLCYILSLKQQTDKQILKGTTDYLPAFILSIIVAFYMGLRPVSMAFGDTVVYNRIYLMNDAMFRSQFHEGEELFGWIMETCRPIMDIKGFFLLIDISYLGFMFWGCKRLMPNNTMAAVLFNIASFSFFTFGTNGIRNGLACSIVILGFAFMATDKKSPIKGLLICLIASMLHKSVALPTAMSIVSIYIIKDFRHAYLFWILSIAISLVFGNSVANLFATMGFDDRMTEYLNNSEYNHQFSSTGFRWDFLLYSAMPIVLGYYIVIKRGIRNRTYEFLLNTYVLSNSFWVMVIRAAFSNRFAYLSWFLYPIVIAYPLLKLPIWKENQGKRLKQIMLANVGFTYIMWLLGK